MTDCHPCAVALGADLWFGLVDFVAFPLVDCWILTCTSSKEEVCKEQVFVMGSCCKSSYEQTGHHVQLPWALIHGLVATHDCPDLSEWFLPGAWQ